MTLNVSLCVPTYRRAATLRQGLGALVDAVNGHPRRGEFEICVSDNGSPDDTPQVIDECERVSGVPFRRERQPENLGFAGNFAAVARLATGDTYCILADDDELRTDALDRLLEVANQLGPDRPLAILNSLPGGDVVVHGQRLPEAETIIDGPGDLLTRLGIFQASFVSNLVFHRTSAIAAWRDEFRRSRYPHTILALELLKHRAAVYFPAALVTVTLPTDTGDQPLLTAIDMARVMADHAFNDPRARTMAWSVDRFLLRMLPTAVYQRRTGKCVGDDSNPYASLRLSNVMQCYRHSWWARIASIALWMIASIVPRSVLGAVLRLVSRHNR